MISPGVASRLLSIHRVLVRYGLDDFVRASHLYRPLRFVFWLSPWTWFRRRRGTRGERLRRALEDLGPIFVKFGQVVSTRRDLLPTDIADELAKLQDRVPPFPGEAAKARVEEAGIWDGSPSDRCRSYARAFACFTGSVPEPGEPEAGSAFRMPCSIPGGEGTGAFLPWGP